MNNTTFAKFATITNLLADISQCSFNPFLDQELDNFIAKLTSYKKLCVAESLPIPPSLKPPSVEQTASLGANVYNRDYESDEDDDNGDYDAEEYKRECEREWEEELKLQLGHTPTDEERELAHDYENDCCISGYSGRKDSDYDKLKN